MSLDSKIKKIYSDITDDDFDPFTGTILLQDDGNGAYIKEWNHPSLSKPTDEQLEDA